MYKVRLRTLLKLTRLTGYSVTSWWCVDSVGGMVVSVQVGGRSEAIEKSTSSRLVKLRLINAETGKVQLDSLRGRRVGRGTKKDRLEFDLASKAIR